MLHQKEHVVAIRQTLSLSLQQQSHGVHGVGHYHNHWGVGGVNRTNSVATSLVNMCLSVFFIEPETAVLLTSGDCCDELDISADQLRVAGVKLHRGSQFEFVSQRILDSFPQSVNFVPSV